MTVLGDPKLDQIVIVTGADLTTPPFDIKSGWAVRQGLIADFLNANKASEALGVAGTNENSLPFAFRNGGAPAIKYGVWAVIGLRSMILRSVDQPWDPTSGYDTPAELVSNVSWPVDISSLTTPTLGLNIDGIGDFDVDFTGTTPVATDGDLSKVVQGLNADATFGARGIAFAEGVGANRRLVLQTQSASGGSVVIVAPGGGDDVSAKFGFTVGQSDSGETPTELFRFQDTPETLIVS